MKANYDSNASPTSTTKCKVQRYNQKGVLQITLVFNFCASVCARFVPQCPRRKGAEVWVLYARVTLVLNFQHPYLNDGVGRRYGHRFRHRDPTSKHNATDQPTSRLKTREKPTLCVFDSLFRQSRPTLEMSISQKYPMHFHTLIFIATTKKMDWFFSPYVGRRGVHFFLENGKLLPQKKFLGTSKFSIF